MRALVIGVLLVGCRSAGDEVEGPRSGTWLEGFSYEWDFFNHRVSYLDVAVDGAQAEVAVVGGTSTTGVVPEYDPGCEDAECDEFPFFDKANITLAWGEVTTETANFAEVSVELLATADGDTQTFDIALDEPPRGDAVALLRGFAVDTNHPLAGDPSCYRPEFGWLPRVLALSIDDVSAGTDESVTLTVSARFEGGNTLEEERRCLDEASDRAVVPIRADILVVFAPGTPETWTVSQTASFEYGTRQEPAAQEPPAP
ncbi:MAG: hypothetical protein ACI8PZ_002539, partial [Myxococcota bacterium]